MVCHETLIRLQVQAEMDGAQGLWEKGPEDCRQNRQRHADHRLDPSEEGCKARLDIAIAILLLTMKRMRMVLMKEQRFRELKAA